MPPLRRTRDRSDGMQWTPEPFPVDVEDRGDEFVVTAELPGLRTQAIDITVDRDRLRIVADFGDEADGTYRRRERSTGVKSRVLTLPVRVDEKSASASYDAGVLRVTLGKRRRTRKVDVE